MDSAEFLDLLGNGNRRRILRLLARKPCYVTEISEQLGVSPKAVIDHLEKLENAGLIQSRTDDRRRKYFSISQHVSLEVTVSPYEFGTRSAYPSNSRFDVTSCRQVSIELESLVSRDSTAAGSQEDAEDDAITCDRGETDTGTTARNRADGSRTAPGEAADAGGRGPDNNTTATDEGDSSGAGPSTVGAPGPESATRPGRAESARPGVATLAQQLREFEQLERELSLLHRWAEGRITDLRERLANRVDVADPRLVSELLVALAEEPHQMERLCQRLGVPPPVVEELLELLANEDIVRREGRRWTLSDT